MAINSHKFPKTSTVLSFPFTREETMTFYIWLCIFHCTLQAFVLQMDVIICNVPNSRSNILSQFFLCHLYFRH
ncbi:hypothetical protein XELAEV_18007464mg [Xenopus laevis]|uniref:Uncharacterized protein n=1 Tax=Xenopus laevis TaxID=8355 RepID=A0A974E0S3_XENLA|nr:hypothetical protein XELAEV_18007464mg [Xenopus laevis]